MKRIIMALTCLVMLNSIFGQKHLSTREVTRLSNEEKTLYTILKPYMTGPRTDSGTYLAVAKYLLPFMEVGYGANNIAYLIGKPGKTDMRDCGTKAKETWVCTTWTYIWQTNEGVITLKMLFSKDANDSNWYLEKWALFE